MDYLNDFRGGGTIRVAVNGPNLLPGTPVYAGSDGGIWTDPESIDETRRPDRRPIGYIQDVEVNFNEGLPQTTATIIMNEISRGPIWPYLYLGGGSYNEISIGSSYKEKELDDVLDVPKIIAEFEKKNKKGVNFEKPYSRFVNMHLAGDDY